MLRKKVVSLAVVGVAVFVVVLLLSSPAVAHAQGTDTAEIPLQPGWNLVSLPLALDHGSLPAVLGPATAQIDLLRVYDAAGPSGLWLSYSPALSPYTNDLAVLDETMGLWYLCSYLLALQDGPSVADSKGTVGNRRASSSCEIGRFLPAGTAARPSRRKA